jgi:hypothetical protein
MTKGEFRMTNAEHLRLNKRSWPELSELEQRAVLCAADLAHDSAMIPIIAGEVLKHFDPQTRTEHPAPEYMI